MSLVAGYSSSDDEEGSSNHVQDVFGLSNIPAAKKIRVEELSSSSLTAAPDVLSEVSSNIHYRYWTLSLTPLTGPS